MKILVILGHPDPGSLNAAIARAAVAALEGLGHVVTFHDLHAEGFDPALPAAEIPEGAALDPVVAAHCAELTAAQGIVVVHPNWWGQPPAILKGWVDRVFRPGVAYRFLEGDGGEGVPQGLLQASQAVVFNTSNTFPQREHMVFGDPLEALWCDCLFRFCGVPGFYRRTFGVVAVSTPEERAAWLEEVAQTMARLFPAEGGE